MVSADNLNLDVLEIIFSFLSGNDLPTVALVSRSFLSAVISRLYNTVSYRLRHGKGYAAGEPMAPFAAVVEHPHLAIHVQNIDIRVVPAVKSNLHPVFVRECRETLRMCKNLKSFQCTVQNVLPMLLPSLLQEKERLETVRIAANLTTIEQAQMLLEMKSLQTLFLEFASWTVVDVLPSWTSSLSGTLTSLSLYMINELNEGIFESVMENLPNLTGLHVVGCPKVDHTVVLKHITKITSLKSLSMTTTESSIPLKLIPLPLHGIKHLTFEAKHCLQPSPSPSILSSVLTYLRVACPSLVSFTLKMPEKKVAVGDAFIDLLMDNHKSTLRRLAFLNCNISRESMIKICKSCVHLERLDVPISVREISAFVRNISHSQTLHTIVDVEHHIDHGVHPNLTRENVKSMIRHCRTLRRVVTKHRVWTGSIDSNNHVTVPPPEKRLSHRHGSLWFLPRE